MRRISTEVRRAIRTDYQAGAHIADLKMKYKVCEASIYRIIHEPDNFQKDVSELSYDDCMKKLRDKKKELGAEVNSARVRLVYAKQAYDQFIAEMRDIFEGGQENGS